MNLLVSFGARGLEDLRKQQNKMKDKGRAMSANQQIMQYGGNGSGGGGHMLAMMPPVPQQNVQGGGLKK